MLGQACLPQEEKEREGGGGGGGVHTNSSAQGHACILHSESDHAQLTSGQAYLQDVTKGVPHILHFMQM